MEKGEMDVAYGRIMLLGTAGVGKTSLKRSLMKLPWESDTTSTSISEVSCLRPFGHQWYNTSLEDDKLIEVTDKDEIDEMAKLLALVYRDPSNTTSVLSSVAASALYNVTSIAKINPSSVPSQNKGIEGMVNVDEILSRAIPKSELMSPGDIKNIKPTPFLHIWDCGGQPVFLEILPAFLTPRTMFLLMFDASKDFKERWQAVRHKAGEKIFEEEVNVSTLDLMLNWMANIHGHLMRYNSDGGCCEYPRMYCIGTHGDNLETEDKRKEVVEKLESHYKDKEYFQLINNTLIIDNTTSGRGRSEDPNLAKVRRAICQFTHDKLIIKTPVSWVLFRKVIQLFDANVIDLDKACEIGVACKIPHDDVPKALLFYHDLGVVLFYPHIKGLEEKVIIKPKWFVETLGKVFTLDEGTADGETRQMWTLLREKGILVQPFYMKIWSECKASDFSPEAIIELLVNFCLAAEVTAEVTAKVYFNRPGKKYFLPAMLKSFKGDRSEVPSGYHLRATPLHITFSTKFVPPGFFTRFVTSFAKQPSCEVIFEGGRIYRNRVTFKYGQLPKDHIIFSDLHSTIQIDVLRYAPEHPTFRSFDAVCQDLLAVLKDCGDQVDQVLTLSSDFFSESFQSVSVSREFKYECRQCPQTNDPHYLVIGDEQLSSVPICCDKNDCLFHEPSAEEAVWFKKEIIQELVCRHNISLFEVLYVINYRVWVHLLLDKVMKTQLKVGFTYHCNEILIKII